MNKSLARFGHHPDAADDFLIEVEELIGMAYNRRVGLHPEPDLESRIDAILGDWTEYSPLSVGFRVGGDIHCVQAKAAIREIEVELQGEKPSLLIDKLILDAQELAR